MLFDTTQLALQRAIEGASLRQTALTANLANAETPGYQRVDVDFHGALSAALAQGDGAASALQGASLAAEPDASATPLRADGSTVDPDAESGKMAANALESQAAVQVARARVQILESAIGVK